MDKIIKFLNQYNKVNITFMYSTPSQYLEALRKDGVKWATKYDDGFPYSDNPEDFWTGYFTSRPTKKKETKDASSTLHATQKLFSEKVLQEKVTDQEVNDILKAKEGFFDAMGVLQHHDAITGTEKQHVADDYTRIISKAKDSSSKVYSKLIRDRMLAETGVQTQNLLTCSQPQNDTVLDCPQAQETADSFIVVAHNAKALEHKQLLRVRLPRNFYTVDTWSKDKKAFVHLQNYDILEQIHFK